MLPHWLAPPSFLLLVLFMNILEVRFSWWSIFEARRAFVTHYRSACRWIATNLPPEAKFLAHDEAMLFLYTGRQAFRVRFPPWLTERQDRQPILDSLKSLDALATPA
jgi:hypothetical protein